VGDPLYGNGTGPGQMKLHAVELGFQHPTSGVEMNFATEPSF
jgi:tRNA pseudouridine32 synthase/23S rRNA pseudouridine746 synthase